MRYIDALAQISSDCLLELKDERKFEHHLGPLGRDRLFTLYKPDRMLCRHALYILKNH